MLMEVHEQVGNILAPVFLLDYILNCYFDVE